MVSKDLGTKLLSKQVKCTPLGEMNLLRGPPNKQKGKNLKPTRIPTLVLQMCCEEFILDQKHVQHCVLQTYPIKIVFRGFPGGAVVENLPANAGDMGLSPGLGRSHMPRSSWAPEPQLLSLRVWSLCSATREAATVRGPRTAMKSGPHLPQLEKSPRTETKTQHSHKKK